MAVSASTFPSRVEILPLPFISALSLAWVSVKLPAKHAFSDLLGSVLVTGMGLIPCAGPVMEGWPIKGYRHSRVGMRPQVGEEDSIPGSARITREMALLQPRLLILGGCMPRSVTGESVPENEATTEESPSKRHVLTHWSTWIQLYLKVITSGLSIYLTQ